MVDYHDQKALIDEACSRIEDAVNGMKTSDVCWGVIAFRLSEAEELSSLAGVCSTDTVVKGVLFTLSSHLNSLHRKVMEVGDTMEMRHGVIRAYEFATAVRGKYRG